MRKPLPTDRPFTTAQARELGHDSKSLTRLVDRRVLRRLLTGVYVDSGVALTQDVRLQAAALVISPDAVLCDRTAAWVWGVDVLGYAELDIMPPLEFYTLRGTDAVNRPECRGGERDLLPEDWCTVNGVRVTTPIRTALDLGCNLYPRDALAAMDALARAHGFTSEDLARRLPRFARRRGVVQLRRLVPLVDPRAESAGESWPKEVLDAHGLEIPEPQWWIVLNGVPTFRLDLAYPHAKIVIEYDGQEFHTAEADRDHDRERRKWLRDHGWYVIVLTKDSFTPEAIQAWITELREVLAERTRPFKRF